jgi:hypothetical protein
LGKGEPKLERKRRSREATVDGRRVDARTESKVGDARRAGGGIGSDRDGDGSAKVVAKSQGDKIVDEEKSRTEVGAATASFKSSVVRTTGNVLKSGDEFGGAEKERVFYK